jgi:hypothetical protein
MIPCGVVATGEECVAFRLWVDGLPEEDNGALIQLREAGFVYHLGELRWQLRRALRDGGAEPVVRIVGQHVLDLLAARRGAACFFLEEGVG